MKYYRTYIFSSARRLLLRSAMSRGSAAAHGIALKWLMT